MHTIVQNGLNNEIYFNGPAFFHRWPKSNTSTQTPLWTTKRHMETKPRMYRTLQRLLQSSTGLWHGALLLWSTGGKWWRRRRWVLKNSVQSLNKNLAFKWAGRLKSLTVSQASNLVQMNNIRFLLEWSTQVEKRQVSGIETFLFPYPFILMGLLTSTSTSSLVVCCHQVYVCVCGQSTASHIISPTKAGKDDDGRKEGRPARRGGEEKKRRKKTGWRRKHFTIRLTVRKTLFSRHALLHMSSLYHYTAPISQPWLTREAM